MKYEITYTCGHKGIIRLAGKEKDRERRLYYEKTCVCPECKSKMVEETRIKKDAEKGIKTPDFLTGKWNGKIYGYGENKSIYIDGDKIELTKEQLEELQTYLEALKTPNEDKIFEMIEKYEMERNGHGDAFFRNPPPKEDLEFLRQNKEEVFEILKKYNK